MGENVQRKKAMRILSLLLAVALFLGTQGVTVFAETISGNQGAGDREQEVTVKEEAYGADSEEQQAPAENGTVKEGNSGEADTKQQEAGDMLEQEALPGNSISVNNAGAGEGTPANPVHHCTKKNDGTDYTDFSYIYFGSYPQSEVTDAVTKQAIDSAISKGMGQAAGTAESSEGTDVWLNGTKYRRISKDDTNCKDYFNNEINNGYRYFKWERIRWRVLKNDGSTLFVVADKAIDCKNYNDENKNTTWENSTIRNWLNSGFFNSAFNSEEQSAIVTQDIVNEDNPSHGTEGGNNTRDNVYLLSISEVTNAAYGFCSDYITYSMSRRMKTSDYAHARGIWRNASGYCEWWLRSPGTYSYSAAEAHNPGYVYRNGRNVDYDNDGLCPVLNISLSSYIWFMTDDGTSGNGGDEKTENPLVSIPAGSIVAKNTKLTLSCATAGAAIYYTTDGAMPTMESALYTGEIVIDRNITVKAVAMCKGYRPSDVAEFAYKIQESGSGEEEKKDDDNKNGANQTSNIKIQKLTIKAPSKKLAAGKKVKLTLNVTPKNAANKAVKWKTSNKKYATVDKNGKITLKKKGIGKNVTITATAQDGSGKKASIKIKIMRHAVKSIKLTAPKKTLKAGKTMTIKATVKTTGKDANKALKWTSSNKKYATVNRKGKVTAKKAGKGKTVTITATSTDGSNKKAKVKIKIK